MKALLPLLAATAVLASAPQALAWGDAGHRMVAVLGVEGLGPELPAFLKTKKSLFQIGELSREPDRSQGGGQPHDHDLDPGHFLDLDDDGRALGGPPLSAMPKDREAYGVELAKVGTTPYRAGFIYYNLVDGWQQLVVDFAYWRVETAALKSSKSRADRAWLKADRQLREAILLRDLGYWAHFVGDGSQPLHMTVHYNGWGRFPNPKGYTDERIHDGVEGEFVNKYVPREMTRAKMYAPETCAPPIEACVTRHLAQSGARMEPLYQLWTEGGFKAGDPRGRAFLATALGEGAARMRDYVTAAWIASGDAEVSEAHHMKVRDAEAGLPISVEQLKAEK